MGKYINRADEFIKGRYKGDSVFDVADEDREYIIELLGGNSLDHDERLLLQTAVGFQEGV